MAWAAGPKEAAGEEGALVTIGDGSDAVDDSAHYGQHAGMEATGRYSAGGPQQLLSSRFLDDGRDSGNGFLDDPIPSRSRPSRHGLDAGVQRSSASRGGPSWRSLDDAQQLAHDSGDGFLEQIPRRSGPSRRSLDEAQQLVQRAHDSFLVQYGPDVKKTVAAKKWLEVNGRREGDSSGC